MGKLGWEVLAAWQKESFAEQELLGRENKSEVMLFHYLRTALEKLNPILPQTAYDKAQELLSPRVANLSLNKINKEKYDLLKNGVPDSYTTFKGKLIKK